MSPLRACPAVLVLVSCATRSYVEQPLEVEPLAATFAARRLDDADLAALAPVHAGEEGPVPWDADALTRVALALRPELDQARAEIEEARAELVGAAVRPNPVLEVTPEVVPGASDPWILTWILELPIQTGGRRQLRVEAAEAHLRAEEFRVPLAAWRVRMEVRSALEELAAARVEVGWLERESALREQRLALEGERLAAGAVDRRALVRVQQERARTDAALTASRGRGARALSTLAEALALPRTALETATIASGSPGAWPEPPGVGDARERALANRLDLRAALAEYADAEAELRLEIARQYPDFRLAPGYSYDQGDHKIALGFALELPLFDRNQGPIAAAEARRSVSAAHFRTLEESALGALESSRVAYAEARAGREILRQAEALSESEWRSVQRTRAEGAVDRSVEIEAELAWVERARASAGAEAELAFARLRLEDQLQCPLEGTAPEVAPP